MASRRARLDGAAKDCRRVPSGARFVLAAQQIHFEGELGLLPRSS